jgi:amino acid adenylation domain-containing protein
VHFHRLKDLLRSTDIEVLEGGLGWEQTQTPLSVLFRQDPLSANLTLTLRYNVSTFFTEQMEQVCRLYQKVLQTMMQTPLECHGLHIGLSERERHQLTIEWNDNQLPLCSQGLVHNLFERQAERNPDAVALVCGRQHLTFFDINFRANQLAHFLRKKGVGPECYVAILAHRTPETIIALLGILKAGGAYVPLDPLSPAERISFFLQDAGVSLLLAKESSVKIPVSPRVRVLSFDSDWATVAIEPGENFTNGATAESAAYVIYTSGSTGMPKGVIVEHRHLMSYVLSVVEALELPSTASFAVMSTLAADLGFTTIFPSLCLGGNLHVLSEVCSSDSLALEEYCSRCPLDVVKITPSHLSALLASPHPEKVLPRARLVLGGEVLSSALVERVRELTDDCAIFNHYGPTETTVGAAFCRVGSAPPKDGMIPLGRPLPGTQIYLMDPDLAFVPLGVKGELCIGGQRLSRGYLNRPDLTAERFVPDPSGAVSGGRIYRTGDQARYLPDGNLEFLGRLDDQVKIRGFRVELGEIEAVLRKHPALQECAVAAYEDRTKETRLVAYVVTRNTEESHSSSDVELRAFLRRMLPAYMVPAAFLRLEALPRHRSGKLDRRSLPEPQEIFHLRAGYVAPRNEVESAIGEIWRQALGVAEVGLDDNFFDLGGHSLIMLRVHSQLRERLGRDFPMLVLFEHSSVRSLAEYLSAPFCDVNSSSFMAAERAGARHKALQGRRQLQDSKND